MERLQNGRRRLKLYADKIYNTGPLITAAWSFRHGPIQPWMTIQNLMMSKLRSCAEWSFSAIMMINKFVGYALAQCIQASPVSKSFHVAVLLSNCRTCLYGSNASFYFSCVPPSLDDYFEE